MEAEERSHESLPVLLVEDCADSREALAELLELSGHRVVTAADGAAALERARAHRPRALLLDLQLPDMSGDDLAAELRRFDGLERALFVAISGHQRTPDEAAARGFDHHLLKPIELPTLLALLG